MEDNYPNIPFRISQLILGFFLHTINEEEQHELDEWVSASIDNQSLFEQCVEIAQRPLQRSDDVDITEDFRYIAELFMKKIKHTITIKELEVLNDWKSSTTMDAGLLKSIEGSTSLEMLYQRLKIHYYNLNSN